MADAYTQPAAPAPVAAPAPTPVAAPAPTPVPAARLLAVVAPVTAAVPAAAGPIACDKGRHQADHERRHGLYLHDMRAGSQSDGRGDAGEGANGPLVIDAPMLGAVSVDTTTPTPVVTPPLPSVDPPSSDGTLSSGHDDGLDGHGHGNWYGNWHGNWYGNWDADAPGDGSH